MAFFSSAIDTLQTLVIALGAGLGVWGVVNLLEGYGSDNPGSKSQGMKQLMAGGVRPLLSRLDHITSYTAPSVSKYTPAHTLPTKLCSANLILRQTHLAKYLPILTRL